MGVEARDLLDRVAELAAKSPHRPARPARPQNLLPFVDPTAEPSPVCCERGWVVLDSGEVVRCPRGCQPSRVGRLPRSA